MRYAPLLLMALVVFVAGCTEQGAAKKSIDYLIYSNQDYGVEMKYPYGWDVNEEAEGIIVAFMSPPEDGNDRFKESVNLVMNDLSGQDMDLETFSTLSVQQIMNVLENVEFLETADTTLDGRSAKRLIYAADGTYGRLAFMQVFTIKDDISYIITYTAEADKISAYMNIAENMLDSFRIRPIPSRVQEESIVAGEPKQNANAPEEFVGKWRAYSEAIFYDAGGSDYLDRASTRILELAADGTWEFGSSSGKWRVEAATDDDWKKWETNPYGPTRKIVLEGWNGGIGDGPIEESPTRVDFVWVIYRNEDASLGPGQVQIKFGHSF